MRTTITIPDAIIQDLQQYTHTTKTTEAINLAIREWLRIKKINEIKKLRGKISIDNNLKTLRKKEIKKLENLDE